MLGVVLAGGQSSRMGQDKSSLTLDGETLLQRSVKLLQQSGAHQVIVSGKGQGQLHDAIDNAGPLAGICTAIITHYQDFDSLLVAPVDMPALNVNDLMSLQKMGKQWQRPAYFEQSYLPLYLTLTEAVVNAADTYLQRAKAGSVGAWLQALSAVPIVTQHPTRLVNVNTPQQWQLFLTSLHPEKGILPFIR